jgi:hypothetical protein
MRERRKEKHKEDMQNENKQKVEDKSKLKLSLCLTKHHAMRMYWGSGSIPPRILNLSARWR